MISPVDLSGDEDPSGTDRPDGCDWMVDDEEEEPATDGVLVVVVGVCLLEEERSLLKWLPVLSVNNG